MYNIEPDSESQYLNKSARIGVRSSEEVNHDFISSSGALMHYLKGSIGSGILAVPMAFKQAGLVVGTLALITIAVAVTHSCIVLVKLSQDICRRHDHVARSYSETAHGVLEYGPEKLRKYKKIICGFIDGGLFSTYIVIVAFYIVFLAHSVKEMILEHLNYDLDDRLYMLILFVPMLFVTQIRSLKYILPLSSIANALLVLTFSIMLYYLFKAELIFKDKALIPRTISGLPEFYGISIFALTSIGALMSIENKMRKPYDYARRSGVIHIGMAIATLIYAIIGFMGYVRFGEDIQPSIALNFPGNEVPALIGKICIVCVIYLTVPVQFHVPLEIWWRLKGNTYRADRQILIEIILRVVLLSLCTICAIAIPRLEYIILLTGAIFFSSLGLCFPVLLELIYLWEHLSSRQKIFILIKDIPIILLSVFGFISATTVTIMKIIKLYK